VTNALNRHLFVECTPTLCPTGEKCSNQRILKRQWNKHLDVVLTNSKGFGVRSKKPIPKGDFIIEYVGEIITEKECR
jgi:histone-lysine N-methyltransferase ASH1L